MSEIQTKEVECYICKDEIRVVFIEDIGMYFCGKLECKIRVMTIRGNDWRPYVQMKDWDKAREIVKNMDEIHVKRDIKGRQYRRGEKRLSEMMRVTKQEQQWILERREE